MTGVLPLPIKTWLRFNAVGIAGAVVHLTALNIYHRWFGMHYLMATALAVETAVLHNYLWHLRWTWAERTAPATSFLRFQFTTGVVSIAGNLFGARLLTGAFGMPVLAANVISIGVLYVFNYLVAHHYVFADTSDRGR